MAFATTDKIQVASVLGAQLRCNFSEIISGDIAFAAFTDSLHVIAILCSVAPALLLISFPFIPESPAWLVVQGRKNEANDVLKHFRGVHYNTEMELARLELQASETREARPNIFDLRNYRKATCITLGKQRCLVVLLIS